jgi:hypothetical protein
VRKAGDARRMAYVVAFAGGGAKDVTRRYASWSEALTHRLPPKSRDYQVRPCPHNCTVNNTLAAPFNGTKPVGFPAGMGSAKAPHEVYV